MINQSKWIWWGWAGHFIGGHNCRFHMVTDIGDYRISTVGGYFPSHKKEDEEPEEIGCNRKYETFVFDLGKSLCRCGCGMRDVKSYSEIDSDGYNTDKDANAGHMAMCLKYARKKA